MTGVAHTWRDRKRGTRRSGVGGGAQPAQWGLKPAVPPTLVLTIQVTSDTHRGGCEGIDAGCRRCRQGMRRAVAPSRAIRKIGASGSAMALLGRVPADGWPRVPTAAVAAVRPHVRRTGGSHDSWPIDPTQARPRADHRHGSREEPASIARGAGGRRHARGLCVATDTQRRANPLADGWRGERDGGPGTARVVLRNDHAWRFRGDVRCR